MTTCRTIIRHAMIELGVLEGEGNPSATEASDGLFRLQAIIDGLFGCGVGTALVDLEVTGATAILTDQRALVSATGSFTITMPDTPDNGSRIQVVDILGNLATYPLTLDGNGRKVEGSATKAITAGGTWIYTADTANWQKVSPLALDDALLLGDDEFFTLETAKRLAPMYGAQMSRESVVALQRAANRIRARFASRGVVPADDAVRLLSRQSYLGWTIS